MIVSGRDLMPVIKSALSRGQDVRMTVHGSSMRPFIANGDTALLTPLGGSPQLGDILLARNADGRYVVHRVVRLSDAGVHLRGDSQPQGEGPFTEERLLGGVLQSERDGHIRRHARGFWRIAGRAWVRAFPLGLRLLEQGKQLRVLASKVLRRLQRFSLFRRFSASLKPDYTVREADALDLIKLHAWLAPDAEVIVPGVGRPEVPGSTTYVAAADDGRIMGVAHLRAHPESDAPYIGWWLYGLSVRSRYRGMGVGRALVQQCANQSRSQGASALHLLVFEKNQPAIALYESIGFERVSLPELEATLVDDVAQYGRQRIPYVKPV